MRQTLLRTLDLDLVVCFCGHLRDEHSGGFFAPCTSGGCDCPDYEPDERDALELAQAAGAAFEATRLSLADAEALIGEPAPAWSGRCYEIATALFERANATGTTIPGRVVYGHYRGVIAPDSPFAARAHLGWVQHGWVDLGDGTVLDPTRWVFENVDPYLYEGPGDDYDEGGNVLRAQQTRPCPPAGNDPVATALTVSLPATVTLTRTSGAVLTAAAGALPLTMSQAHWVATLPLPVLGDHAAAVYAALEDAGFRALIPIDNLLKVTGG